MLTAISMTSGLLWLRCDMSFNYRFLRPEVHPKRGPQHGYVLYLVWNAALLSIELDHDLDIGMTYSPRDLTRPVWVKILYTGKYLQPIIGKQKAKL